MDSNKEQIAATLTSIYFSLIPQQQVSRFGPGEPRNEEIKNKIMDAYHYFIKKLEEQKNKLKPG
jgi:hypothetical protein